MNPSAEPRQRTVGVLLFDRFETLDACGPIEMFGTLADVLSVKTVAQHAGPIASVHGVQMMADYDFVSAPYFDILLVPGGIGTRTELANPVMLDWLRRQFATVELMLSVCTGAFLLASAGILDGRRATTNKRAFEEGVALSDQVNWIRRARWVEDGNLISSSGVSAGMDMALAVVARLYGEERAEFAAKVAEYRWVRDSEDDPFA